MRLMPLITAIALAGCANGGGGFGTHETAKQALRIFCIAHAAELTHILLTQEQIHAGNVVCYAIGYPLGNPPIADRG